MVELQADAQHFNDELQHAQEQLKQLAAVLGTPSPVRKKRRTGLSGKERRKKRQREVSAARVTASYWEELRKAPERRRKSNKLARLARGAVIAQKRLNKEAARERLAKQEAALQAA